MIAESSNIIVGEKSNISIKLLDENDNPVVSELDIPLSISTNLGYVPSYILLPAGTDSSVIEYSSEVSGIGIISVKSKGLIGDTGSIAVMPLPSPTPPAIGNITISSGPPGASIYLDGSNKGETPKVITDVPQGYHRIELNHPGFSNWSNTSYVAPGVSLSITANLNAIPLPIGVSSGGGGGVVTSEPYDNILKAQSIGNSLIANKPVVYRFTVPELGIYEIVVTGRESEGFISLRVEALKGTSKLVRTPAPGTVYRNVSVWAGTKRIKEALVRFKVENSWLSQNSLESRNIWLVKWDGSKWVQLETSELTKNSTYTYFEAKTDTFSMLAIVAIETYMASQMVIISVPTQEVTQTPPPATRIASMRQSTISILVYVLILFMVVGMYYFFDIKGKKRND